MRHAVHFEAPKTIISAGFWGRLAQMKLNEIGLDDTPLTVWGHYELCQSSSSHLFLSESSLPPIEPRAPTSNNTSGDSFNANSNAGSKNSPNIDSSFSSGINASSSGSSSCREELFEMGRFGEPQYSVIRVMQKGRLYLFNSIEAYRSADRRHLMAQFKDEVLTSGSSVAFCMIAFADIKKYQFRYNILHPAVFDSNCVFEAEVDPVGDSIFALIRRAVMLKSPLCSPIVNLDAVACRNMGPRPVDSLDPQLIAGVDSQVTGSAGSPAIHAVSCDSDANLCPQAASPVGSEEAANQGPMSVFVDCCSCELTETLVLGWYARNLLYSAKEQNVTWLRLSSNACFRLRILPVSRGRPSPMITGWERHLHNSGECVVDLGATMDPMQLARTASRMNLSLIRWRLLPDFNIDLVAGQKVLIVGAGTLGCNVARALLGWGVSHYTFVDHGRVSYSNPARQSLFRHSDCQSGGLFKAPTAALRMQEIDPNVLAHGENMLVPMPGHIVTDAAECAASVAKLWGLVQSHSVVFSVTDSREARWLPTLLASVLSRTCITIALGFDSYVAMRHGIVRSGAEQRLACYFCHDIQMPGDSQSFRTLDQQCTVTRPGVSMMAAASGVELLASLLHHPHSAAGPANVPVSTASTPQETLPPNASPLGVVPHQIRGYVSHQRCMHLVGEAFSGCTACSPLVVDRIRQLAVDPQGELQATAAAVDFLVQALDEPETIDSLCRASVPHAAAFSASLDACVVDDDGFCLL